MSCTNHIEYYIIKFLQCIHHFGDKGQWNAWFQQTINKISFGEIKVWKLQIVSLNKWSIIQQGELQTYEVGGGLIKDSYLIY
jgi:hypothetical protein